MGDKREPEGEERTRRGETLLLAFATIGVVFGDIGTSPLYAFRECFSGRHSIDPTPDNILGVVSLIFWALVIVISIKYLLLVLRADNQGEGGVLALMELVVPKQGRSRAAILVLGLFGAALLYGDGTITPAISVLGAIEGLKVATPALDSYVIPIALSVLVPLFLLQKKGSGRVGLFFSPIMSVWFLVLAVSGAASVARHASVLEGLSPLYALRFVARFGGTGLFVLGAVFLVVTGGEALYADIGHFGKGPIRLSWFGFVLPCLLLNYLGQGALLLENRELAVNPFYHMVPRWSLYPMVALATLATIIASQAIISGAFSLTFQAINLGYLPRLRVRHTSERQSGQIYYPEINWLLFAATAAVILGFRTSSNLAAAYGVAVSTTMVITTILAFAAMRRRWGWRITTAAIVAGTMLLVDLAFFSANILKVSSGGWYPLAVAAVLYFLMDTWRRGAHDVELRMRELVQPLEEFIQNIDMRGATKVKGAAIYLSKESETTPPAFVQNVRINKIVHRRVIFLTVLFEDVPHVQAEERVRFERLSRGYYRVTARYGFMDRPDVSAVVRIIDNRHLKIDLDETTYIVSRQTLVPRKSLGMSIWRDRLYLALSRASEPPARFFNLPPARVLEIGGQIPF